MSGLSGELERAELTLGFIPLTDCAPLVVAREKHFFADQGLDVTLSREPSWANIRDKVAVGALDGAQMLAPMPIASSLGVGAPRQAMVTGCCLDLNGNAITVATALFARMQAVDPAGVLARPMTAGPLRQVIAERAARGLPRLTFAVVYPVSTHTYQLRYWMASAGIDPDRDVRLVVVPPPQMVDRLAAGDIDGYCVGEPWNTLAVQGQAGRTLITSYEIWNNSAEKVFAVNEAWAEANPNTHRAVIMALLEAARWLDQPDNRVEAAVILARPEYVAAPASIIAQSILGGFRFERGEPWHSLPDFNVFHRYQANFPWQSQAAWFISQMLRWGQIETPLDIAAAASAVYRPEIYRGAAEALGIAVPGSSWKSEGAHAGVWRPPGAPESIALGPDLFFDGRRFDPARIGDYLNGFEVNHCRVPVGALAVAPS
ncbi:MAG: ABC transporter substrate-binding protein [Gammaproteobacteria bacterium]|nr:ABC transporter substrate-binding protein [Gammaproteobacteria bacterium]